MKSMRGYRCPSVSVHSFAFMWIRQELFYIHSCRGEGGLAERISLQLSHTHAGLRAAAADCPHLFVDVLLELKLWLVRLLHGPVLQFPGGDTQQTHGLPRWLSARCQRRRSTIYWNTGRSMTVNASADGEWDALLAWRTDFEEPGVQIWLFRCLRMALG